MRTVTNGNVSAYAIVRASVAIRPKLRRENIMTNLLAVLPFSGFYGSWHDDEMNQTLEQAFSDHATGCNINDALIIRAHDAVSWPHAFKSYARLYSDAFRDEFDIPSLEFESLQSPREYNFETDRIFVHVSRDDIASIWKGLNRDIFKHVCTERFTHRSGFVSFYEPDWKAWGKLSAWDHNQLGALLEAHAHQHSTNYVHVTCDPDYPEMFTSYREFELMEGDRGNGEIDSLLFNTPEMNRLGRVHNYLNARAERD